MNLFILSRYFFLIIAAASFIPGFLYAMSPQTITFPEIGNQWVANWAVTPSISAGSSHSLFLKTGGTVWAAGENGSGQLGDGTTASRSTPVQVMTSVQAIAGGHSHSLLLKTNGSVWATGFNSSGRLGDGTTTNRSTPVQVMASVQAIAAGDSQSLFLKTDGSVWGTGFNGFGQLGDGTITSRSTPVQVKMTQFAAMTDVQAIAAGASHSLFLKVDGTVWATGHNAAGQLGDGTTTGRSLPGQVLSQGQVMTGVQAIAAGTSHSLFLRIDGTVWAVGDNAAGQLGDGTTTSRSTPRQVMMTNGKVMTGVQAIAAGNSHSLFLRTDGTVWAAGWNVAGQLGDGTITNRSIPVQVMTGVQAISAGSIHSLFFRIDMTVWAVGDNRSGQLGDGTTTNQLLPVQVMDVTEFNRVALNATASSSLPVTYTVLSGPATVSGSTVTLTGGGTVTIRATQPGNHLYAAAVPITQMFTVSKRTQTITFPEIGDQWTVNGSVNPAVSAGGYHSLFLKTGGTVWSAGENGSGQLGVGTTASRSTPVQVMTGVQAIAAGGSHSLLLKANGSVWAAGFNNSGRLGDGTTTNRSIPVEVMTSVQAIAAGGSHSLFLRTNGSVWVAGANSDGQLGDGTTTSRSTPVQVMTGVQSIAASGYHSLFLKIDGTVWAAGNNILGQLGDGTTTNRSIPVQVMTSVQAIVAGSTHSLFLKTDGTVWAAGNNSYGRLGDGTTINRSSPVQVMAGVQAIAAGDRHSLFLKTDGTVWGAGANFSGELGDGTITNRSSPVQVMVGVQAIAAGAYHSLFVKIEGAVWTAGNNSYGQLGDGTTTHRSTPVQVMDVTERNQVTLNATTSSGLAVTYTVVSGPATLSGSILNLTGEGMVTISADQFGNSFYEPATAVTQTFTVSKIPQTISFPAIEGHTHSGAISAGGYHSLFLKTRGTVCAAGENGFGQLGGGPLSGIQAIAAGDRHSLFIKTNGSVWVAGYNTSGQLGDGTTNHRTTPVQVMTGVQAVAASGHSLFLRTDSSVWATGQNGSGQLGDGTTASRSTPVQIMTSVRAIAAGSSSSLFLKTDGSVWAAGNNGYGQLGDGTTINRSTPVQIMTGVKDIAAGGLHSLFLKTDGTVWSTGRNASGQLGDRTFTSRSTPVQVMTDVQAVAAGGSHSLFLKTDGTVWAAGSNSIGQIGAGTTGNRPTPVQVMTGVQDIAAGGYHSLFLKIDGTVWATGDNGSRRLGDGTTTHRFTPVQVMDVTEPNQVPLNATTSSGLLVTYTVIAGPATVSGSILNLTGDGSVTISASQTGNYLYAPALTVTQTFDVFRSSRFISFDSWTDQMNISDVHAEPASTPFHDGVSNLLKYAFNLNGNAPDSRTLVDGGTAGLPRIDVDAGSQPLLRMEFLRRKSSLLIYIPEYSENMKDFVPLTGVQTVTSVDDIWEKVLVVGSLPQTKAKSAFARVKVQLMPNP